MTTIAVGLEPRGVAIEGTRAWIAEAGSHTVSVIETGTQSVIATIALGANSIPSGVSVTLVPGAPMPQGSTFTIVTNANGTFAALPDGATILTAFGKFRISYTGGPTQTDVVLIAL